MSISYKEIWLNNFSLFHFNNCRNEGSSFSSNINKCKNFHESATVDKLFDTHNPFKIIDNLIDLRKLKNEWDPTFKLSEFKNGSMQVSLSNNLYKC